MKNRRVPLVHGSVLLVLLVMAMALVAPGTHALTMTGILKDNSNKGLQKFTKKEEREYIEQNGLQSVFSVKVTTKNQSKFDTNHDGYLSGEEMKEYLKKYD